ncbi:MAG: polyprenyl synthetase family protein [Pseudomonadota bacterium]
MPNLSQSSPSLQAALQATARAVDERLSQFLPEAEGHERRLLEAMRYAAIGAGKRLRPLLVLASSELFGVSRESALQVGAAIECVHAYSLVHDDLPCMDDDDLRRGKPTVHKAYDEATAVLAGDALLTLAFDILTQSVTHPDPHVRVELVASLAHAAGARGMVGGQAIDLAAEKMDMDLGAITRLQQLKTGALICFSAEAGAILGKAGGAQRQALRGYAHDLGLAFQIADDLLDVEGDAAVVGKATGKDGKAGKATFVSLLGVERARQQALMLVEQAIAHLAEFGEGANLLRAIAHFVIDRDK